MEVVAPTALGPLSFYKSSFARSILFLGRNFEELAFFSRYSDDLSLGYFHSVGVLPTLFGAFAFEPRLIFP